MICAILAKEERVRKQQWPFCHGQPRSRRILVSASLCRPVPKRLFHYTKCAHMCIFLQDPKGRLKGCGGSYLAGGDELERSQSTAHVWNVGLELVESVCNVGLDLRRVLSRGAVARDLVECGHCGCMCDERVCCSRYKRNFSEVEAFAESVLHPRKKVCPMTRRSVCKMSVCQDPPMLSDPQLPSFACTTCCCCWTMKYTWFP